MATPARSYLLGEILYLLKVGCPWHRQWRESLVRIVIDDTVRDRDTIQGWIHQWYPLASSAVHTFKLLLQNTLEHTGTPALQHVGERSDRSYRKCLEYLGSMRLELAS